jgi:hypothetical protein
MDSGRLDAAHLEYCRAHSMAVELGEQHLAARALLGIGRCLRRTNPHGAAEHLADALGIFERLRLPDADDARSELARLRRDHHAG